MKQEQPDLGFLPGEGDLSTVMHPDHPTSRLLQRDQEQPRSGEVSLGPPEFCHFHFYP